MSYSIQDSNNPVAWDELVREAGGHPLQLWGWGELKSRHRFTAERLIVRDGDTVVALAQLLTRKLPGPFPDLVYCPRGPVVCDVSTAEIADLLLEHVKRNHKALAFSIEPDEEHFELTSKWQRAKSPILPARTLILDLQQSDDALLGDMTKKHRQYIRKSEREPSLEIRPVTSLEQLEECLAIYEQTAERAQFGLHEHQYYVDAFEQLGDRNAIWASYEHNLPVAFLWLTHSDRTSFELYGGMSARGQELRANYALKWHAIRTMKARGVHRYDLGGLINDGVTTFKKGFASHENVLAGTWDYPLSTLYTLWSGLLPTAKKVFRSIKRR